MTEEEGKTETDAIEGMEISTRSKGKKILRKAVFRELSKAIFISMGLHSNIESVVVSLHGCVCMSECALYTCCKRNKMEDYLPYCFYIAVICK